MSLSSVAEKPAARLPIDLGVLPSALDAGLAARAAIGLVVLATDQTMEHEFRALIRIPTVNPQGCYAKSRISESTA